MNLKEALKDKLSKEELKLLQRSYEVLGDIAIIAIEPQLEKKKMIIAQTLKDMNPHIKVVLRKISEITGELRVGRYELLIGNRTETVHREFECRFKLDPTKVYFTEKLASERIRIASQVKNGERILCMFAGVGPFPIVIAKRKDVVVYAVELNKDAFDYMDKNIMLNNVYGKVLAFCGDVKEVVPSLNRMYDRILMPAPKSAEDFLDVALRFIKKDGIIHFYAFANEEEGRALKDKLFKRCSSLGKKVRVLEQRRCGAFKPHVYRVVLDLKVLN